MQLIEFETRLEKGEKWENPYKFKTYAKVSLNFQDAKDIELIKTQLTSEFLESIDWEEGTAFFEPFYLSKCSHRYRKEETIDALTRIANKLNQVHAECKEFSEMDKKERLLDQYYWNKSCIERQLHSFKESLETRQTRIQDCINTLSSEECELLGIKDVYVESSEIDLWDVVYREKKPVTT